VNLSRFTRSICRHQTTTPRKEKQLAHPEQFQQKKSAYLLARTKETFEQLHHEGELRTSRFFIDTARYLVPHLVPRPEEV